LILRLFNHVAGTRRRAQIRIEQHGLLIAAGTVSHLPRCGTDVKPGRFPVTTVGKLSVVAAYVAFAVVGAIVLGVL
jgi:hypothetical protein